MERTAVSRSHIELMNILKRSMRTINFGRPDISDRWHSTSPGSNESIDYSMIWFNEICSYWPSSDRDQRFLSLSRMTDAISLLQLYGIIHSDSKVADYQFSDVNPHDLIEVRTTEFFSLDVVFVCLQAFINDEARIPDLLAESVLQAKRKSQQKMVTNG